MYYRTTLDVFICTCCTRLLCTYIRTRDIIKTCYSNLFVFTNEKLLIVVNYMISLFKDLFKNCDVINPVLIILQRAKARLQILKN